MSAYSRNETRQPACTIKCRFPDLKLMFNCTHLNLYTTENFDINLLAMVSSHQMIKDGTIYS